MNSLIWRLVTPRPAQQEEAAVYVYLFGTQMVTTHRTVASTVTSTRRSCNLVDPKMESLHGVHIDKCLLYNVQSTVDTEFFSRTSYLPQRVSKDHVFGYVVECWQKPLYWLRTSQSSSSLCLVCSSCHVSTCIRWTFGTTVNRCCILQNKEYDANKLGFPMITSTGGGLCENKVIFIPITFSVWRTTSQLICQHLYHLIADQFITMGILTKLFNLILTIWIPTSVYPVPACKSTHPFMVEPWLS